MVTFKDIKPIRNRLRQFEAGSLLRITVDRLHAVRNLDVDLIRVTPPWNLLLLVKWTLRWGEFNPRLPAATSNDFARLMNMIHDLHGRVRMPSEYDDIFTFLKCVACQQFWLQQGIGAGKLGRQVLLYDTPLIRQLFKRHTGVELDEFLAISFSVLSYFMANPGRPVVARSHFDLIARAYSPEAVDRSLSLLSLDLEGAREFLERSDVKYRDNEEFQLYEQTPLKLRPMLRIGESFVCYSPNLLTVSLASLVYDILKDVESAAFSAEFGEPFERYVGLGISHLGVPFSTEADLRCAFGDCRLVDFVVPSDGINVMIEAKGIEMNPQARVSPNWWYVGNSLRDSVVKAVTQGLVTANKIVNGGLTGASVANSFHLLIVTFKDLYVGNGERFFRGQVRQQIETFAAGKALDLTHLPFERIHIVSIDEFDALMDAVRSSGRSLGSLLNAIVDADKQDRKLQLRQNLEAIVGALRIPGYASRPFEEMSGDVIRRMQAVEARST